MTSTPEEFICPLTKKILQDPMMSRYGTHFERSAIMEWFDEGNTVCPVTRNPLRPSNLVSNKTLQWKIRYWMEKNSISYERDNPQEAQGSEDKTNQEQEQETVSPTNSFGCMGFSIAIIPKRFICPLTKQCMEDPVTCRTPDGFRSFERNAILKWLDAHGDICPITGNGLTPSGLYPNNQLKFEISQWQLNHGDATNELKRLEREDKLNKNNENSIVMKAGNAHITDLLYSLLEINPIDDEDGGNGETTTTEDQVLSVLDQVVDTIQA